MMEIILAGVVSLVITLAAGKLLIPALIRLKAGQSIKEVGPTWHKGKQGTPTMGGLMFIIGIGIAILILGWKGMLEGNFTHLYVYVFALVFGVIGYIDDYQKVKHHQNTGLTAPQKFLLQLAAAVAFLCLMRYEGMLSPNLYIPFFNTHLVLPWVVYMIFAAFVIIGTVNAVNITDGVDGLSSSVTVPVAVFFAVLGGLQNFMIRSVSEPSSEVTMRGSREGFTEATLPRCSWATPAPCFWAARWRPWPLPMTCP